MGSEELTVEELKAIVALLLLKCDVTLNEMDEWGIPIHLREK